MTTEPLLDPASVVSAHSDQLHRAIERSGVCTFCVLIDSRLSPLEDDHLLVSLGRPSVRVKPRDSRVEAQLCPTLFALDPSRARDSFALQSCIAEALVERAPESVNAGNGRRISAFLMADAPLERVAQHLGQSLVHRAPSAFGDHVWTQLHFYDPAVMWWLWPILTGVQRQQLLGPIQAWCLLDPIGAWQTLDCPQRDDAQVSATLMLDEKQWPDVRGITALNAALRDCLGSGAGPSAASFALYQRTAFDALRRAHRHGWHAARDQSAFVLKALTVSPQFDSHPKVQALLAARQAGVSFQRLIDELGDVDWQRIRADLQTTSQPTDSATHGTVA